ncbi:aspartate/glutamate racemase family protein [Rubellimicrobium aerolatum]|uniref:Aspartate/glutamate racemase family protein n=1 Tax=Rubellimicrobium aerolatum TaxID=490979 RepID=A0ABW0SC84_9RHOB|nr:aspartate/glutamate racemase family protein [Rubellimicrobium aerolatum]MBP1806291.1 allantoin racemase [Rubellimicrobium aerolatum]
MRLLLVNPNSTAAMTDSAVAVARRVLPEAEVLGWTNHDGPPAIQGPADGAAAVAGLRAMLPRARAEAVDALVIACFDDTGLQEIRAAAHCPVIGIGQAAVHLAALLVGRFSVVTTLPVSVPVLEGNIAGYGFGTQCARVRPSGLPVLEVEAGGPAVMARLAEEIEAAAREDGAQAVVLGCAGMAPLRAALQARSPVPLVDGVEAAALLGRALAGWRDLERPG